MEGCGKVKRGVGKCVGGSEKRCSGLGGGEGRGVENVWGECGGSGKVCGGVGRGVGKCVEIWGKKGVGEGEERGVGTVWGKCGGCGVK